MNLSTTAKDVLRVATTAGLSKDVIDLLTAKVSLLDEKLSDASIRVSELEAENKELRGKMNDSPGVACEAAPILEALHVSGPLLTIREICQESGIAADEVEHIFTVGLVTNGFVEILKDDALFWTSLRNTIQASLATLPDVSWRPRFAFPRLDSDTSSIQRTKKAAIQALVLTSEDSMQAIFHTMREHKWPELSAPELWSLSIALSEIVRFLDLCFVEDAGRSMTLFRSLPTDNLTTAAVWFCFQWWPGPGARRWLDDAMRDETSFYTHFARQEEE